MARSKHTDPREIRAARRLRDPFEPRGARNPQDEHALARALKAMGVVGGMKVVRTRHDVLSPLPGIIVRRPRQGFVHPATRADIEGVLRYFGEEYVYGLRSIELVQGTGSPIHGRIQLAMLRVPGRIILYDQLPSPWRLAGCLPTGTAEQLRAAGAILEASSDGIETVITWPGSSLRDFVLFDGLMHEIGHHLLQHHKGKRFIRIARTKDHASFAESFARRCRAAFLKKDEGGS